MTGDERPDPRLQAALRHAPDAGLQAPEALREHIVGAARAALSAERAARPAQRRWWQRLWPAGPIGLGASGAFATLALGGLIALLWRGEPPPAVAPAEVAVPAQGVPAVEASRDVEALKLEERRTAASKAAPPAAPRREATPRPRAAAEVEEARKAMNQLPALQPAAPPVAAAAPDAAPGPAAVTVVPPAAKDAAPALAAPPAGEASRAAVGLLRQRAAGAASLAPGASRTAEEEEARWLATVRLVVQERGRPTAESTIPGARERRFGSTRVAVGAGRVLWCDDGTPPACREAALAPKEEAALLAAMPR